MQPTPHAWKDERQLLCSRGSELAEVRFAVLRISPTGLCKYDRHIHVEVHSRACMLHAMPKRPGMQCSEVSASQRCRRRHA